MHNTLSAERFAPGLMRSSSKDGKISPLFSGSQLSLPARTKAPEARGILGVGTANERQLLTSKRTAASGQRAHLSLVFRLVLLVLLGEGGCLIFCIVPVSVD